MCERKLYNINLLSLNVQINTHSYHFSFIQLFHWHTELYVQQMKSKLLKIISAIATPISHLYQSS